MIRAFFSALFYGGTLLAALYLVTGVPLGQHTLAGHLVRIFETEEARELREEVERTSGRVEQRVRREAGTYARGERSPQP
ncbi:MAG: hypothetical protein ACOC97_04965 [Myxococcota bacterium]